MTGQFEITIDGRKLSGQPGDTILEVARRNGIFIPALCAHPLLKPYGACRLCLVEIQHRKRTRLVASCAYPAEPGLAVRTSTDQVIELRRGIIELLLARCPESEPLRALAARLGVSQSRFPTLGRSDEKCVLCGLCVRVCAEAVGSSAISFINRGRERRVDSPFSLGSEDCLGCCACAAVCPSGAVALECAGELPHLAPFNITMKLNVCVACGKPIAPAPLLGNIISRMPFPVAGSNLCPACKAAQRAQTLLEISRRHKPCQTGKEAMLRLPFADQGPAAASPCQL